MSYPQNLWITNLANTHELSLTAGSAGCLKMMRCGEAFAKSLEGLDDFFRIEAIGAKIEDVEKTRGSENPLATMANIGSRILLMLLEVLMIRKFIAKWL